VSAPAAPAAPRLAGPRSLLGRLAGGALDEEITEVVLAELRRSSRPVSLPGLLNVLWFGRGELGCYDGAAFGEYLDGLLTFSHETAGEKRLGEAQEAVPLGALVKVEIGDDEAWGEVIWKEGAHPLVGAGWVPGWLAGAPAGMPYDAPPPSDFTLPDGPRLLRERIVVDFKCLGDAFAPSEAKLARLRRRGRRLDRYGHLVAEVAYRDGLDEADELTFWAAWTVQHHPLALAAADIPAQAAALAEAASVLAVALGARDDVRSFGPYYIDADLYERVVKADEADDGALRRTVRGLALLPHHEQVAWASMSARIADCADEDDVIGDRWPLAVVCASLLALDKLAAEAADGDWNGVHLRLDDLWQGGGLWRAELLGTVSPVSAEPAVALGLGWVAHTGGAIDRVSAVDADLDLEEVDEDDLSWDVVGSDATWTVHLSNADLDNDRLRVPKRISELIAANLHTVGQDRILVLLRHDGDPESREWSLLDGEGHLTVPWPLGAWAGTTVRVTWALDATIVTGETRVLAEPELVGDIAYTHEFNLAVALAAAGLAERVSRTATIGQIVRAIVRRHGAVTEDGRAALPIDDVVTFCFGPRGEAAPGYGLAVLRRAVLSAVGAMSAAGIASIEAGMIVVSERITGAGRRADSDLLSRFVDAQRRRLRRAAYLHYVPATVVNLPAGHRRSEDKEAQWAEVAGTDYLPKKLAEGQTWRRRHIRGQGMDPDVQAHLRRAKEAIRRLGGDEDCAASLDNALADPFAPDSDARHPDGAPGDTSIQQNPPPGGRR
jgi:hypothetical protein